MSDRINGSPADPWTPVRREPLAAKPEPKAATKPVPLSLTIGVPPDTFKPMADLAEAQTEIGERLDKLASIIDTMAKANESTAKTMMAVAEQLRRQTEAMLSVTKRVESGIAEIQAAMTAPRKVTLRRDAAGVAVDAVSTVQRQ